MRDIVTIPITTREALIIASDNSGAIGMKHEDSVKVPYETVAYYSFRVAAMECIAAGGEPISVVLHNFCGNEPWEELVKGIQTGLGELGLNGVSITGSTESNFSLNQSAVGLIVIGKKVKNSASQVLLSENVNVAIIGMPLVGNEVVEQQYNVAPLSIFQEISRLNEVVILPVGSKGILYEMNQLFSNVVLGKENLRTDVEVLKSSGPSTCFIVVFQEGHTEKIRKAAGDYFHPLKIEF
ncbi:ATP-binding protein [Bacillus sp. MUM 116]|uniref:ATP-binding protein n=1 Tax=Bacillus sp. MUM 116 TaxID=1678002 RepID=UPI0008F5863C|nr:ATP-binding protein [Bacillus sp. MUM 116]OIK14159.1 ATP-binding protein [Bacillus sp. MUM 116]